MVKGGLVTAEVRDAPLAEVLRAIGGPAGIAVAIEGAAARPVSISLAEAPVAEAIRLLLRDAASSVIYRFADGQLAEVRVRLANSQAQPPASVRSMPSPAAPAAFSETGAAFEDLAVTADDPYEERLAFVRKAVRAPRTGSLDTLTTLALDDEDPLIRKSAAGALGSLRTGAAGEVLVLALADRDRRVRRAAARAFGAVGGEQAIEALERVLPEERASEVRRMAAYALSRMGNEPALAALEIARSDRDRTVRNIAEAALSGAQD